MPITNHAYYYSSAYPYNRDEMERNFIRDFVISGNAHADLQRIKGYSPKDILERIHQSPSTETEPNPIKNFVEEIWGPFLALDDSPRTKNLYAAVLTRLETFSVI